MMKKQLTNHLTFSIFVEKKIINSTRSNKYRFFVKGCRSVYVVDTFNVYTRCFFIVPNVKVKTSHDSVFFIMAKYIFLLIMVCALLLAAEPHPLYPDVTVLSSDRSGITLELRPQYTVDKKIDIDGREYSVPQFKFSVPYRLNQPGAEDVRSRTMLVALPGFEGHQVTVVSSDFETISSYRLAPMPEISGVDSLGGMNLNYREAFQSGGTWYPQSIVTLNDVAEVKGFVVGNLSIQPYQYLSSSRTLRKYSRIVVRIDFGSGIPSGIRSGNADWAKASLINYSASMLWSPATRKYKTVFAANSVLSSGTWIKLEVNEEGVYKIDAPYLRSLGIDPSSLGSITDVKLFGADGRIIPENLAVSRPSDLPQIAVDYIDKNGNGKFDQEDFILFVGQGINGWNYDPVQKQFSHYGNPYTFSNFYFLSVGSSAPVKSVQQAVIAPSSGARLKQTPAKVFFDEDKFNFNQSGLEWVSAPINPGESRTVSSKLFGWVPGTPVTYRYQVFGRATVSSSISVDESGQSLASAFMAPVDFDGYHYYAWPDIKQAVIVPSLTDERSNVKFTYNSSSSISSGFIGWLRIFYTRQLSAVNNLLMFSSPDTSGTVTFELNGFSHNDLFVYEYSQMNSVRRMQYQLQQQTGSCTVTDTLSSGAIRRYWAGTADQFKTPKAFVKIPNSNLHAHGGAEFVIITHNDFKSEAQRLKQHKESLPGSKKISTAVIDVDTLFNEFGIGMPDPSAVRDFLRYAVEQWTVPPRYVLFFGDGSYDYRSIIGNDRSWVPTYETAESNVKISSYANEDFFSYINPSSPTTVAFAHGRLTPRTAADAKELVDKIILYETALPQGEWKNLVTLVADDMWTPQNQSESDHIYQTESIAGIVLARDFDAKRIYMEEYPTVFSSSGRRKPAVREAILNQVNNEGTLLLNFVGHGNPKVWAHESILTLDDTRSQFVNSQKLTFIVAATCDWGRFDEAGEPSSAEEVVLNRKGGAIGVLSATRAVYSNENALTNQKFYDFLFSGSPTIRVGDAYLLMKNSLSAVFYLENKQKYFLLGDPTITLAAPSGRLSVDSVQTADGALADTMLALQKIIIKGTIRDSANGVMTGFNGTASLTINDAERTKTVSAVPGFSYKEIGSVIYRGTATVSNGTVTASFIVPKDISYANQRGKISIYFSNTSTDGRGFNRSVIIGGSNLSAPPDSAGPEITIFLDNTNFRPGDVVSENPKLFVSLKDSSGINSSTNSIGHRLEAWIDGSTKSIDLTAYYKGTIDSYQEGSAEVQLEGLSQGNHSIKVRAWDVYNNSSSAETFFAVAPSSTLSIQQLYNFPNPVSTSTMFTFQHNQLIPIDVTISIFTVAGRLIRTIEHFSIPDRFVRIGWDRTDRDGDEVGNGIYFYKVIAKTIDGRFTSEAIGKMAVVR